MPVAVLASATVAARAAATGAMAAAKVLTAPAMAAAALQLRCKPIKASFTIRPTPMRANATARQLSRQLHLLSTLRRWVPKWKITELLRLRRNPSRNRRKACWGNRHQWRGGFQNL